MSVHRTTASVAAVLVMMAVRLVDANPFQSRWGDHHLFWQAASSDSSSSEMDYVNDNPVIEVDESGMPVCPPPTNHPEGCYAKVCRSDIDCLGGDTERVCCYNGCVRTCMIKVKPPPFFDWEETSVGDPLTEQGKIPAEADVIAEFQRPSIVLTLPGGCHLTQEQYDSYQQFQKSPHIRQCYCVAGDVFCQINTTDP